MNYVKLLDKAVQKSFQSFSCFHKLYCVICLCLISCWHTGKMVPPTWIAACALPRHFPSTCQHSSQLHFDFTSHFLPVAKQTECCLANSISQVSCGAAFFPSFFRSFHPTLLFSPIPSTATKEK